MSSDSTIEADDVASFTTTYEEEVDANFSQLVLQDIGLVKGSFEAVKHKADQLIDEANEARKKFEELMLLPEGRTEERNFKLRQLKKKVSKLRMKIPFKLIAPEEQPHPNINYWPRPELDKYQEKDGPSKTNNIDDHDHGNSCYDNNNDDSPALSHHELETTIRGLGYNEKIGLACFYFFPENAFIKRSVLHYWYETVVYQEDQVIDALVEKSLIQVYMKFDMTVTGYRMYPSVHFNLRSNISWFDTVLPSDFYLGNSHDVYEKYIYYTAQDFQHFIPTGAKKWILHLGKWNNSTEQHIEIINQEMFFKNMEKLTYLMFLSLRGISMIEELPKFITELSWLRFLDLKSCHNLEVIPSSIANLICLEHLDISECYFLNHMPKALAELRRLRVLKGFVVGENKDGISCSLEDLASLLSLEKLNIYTSVKGFPNNSQLATLQRHRILRSLTISWGGCVATNGLGKSEMTNEVPIVAYYATPFPSIVKLDLQCVPETVTRHWLNPTNFHNLRKLYIRGGQFNDLGHLSSRWDVEILRLKHLSKLIIYWSNLRKLFPKLCFLEKVSCPNLVQFPCDTSGIWKNN